ncbi:hypothetical protein ACH35V_05210 [Actinomadura sp. 1N219]|uniref:hypothetical protein n=1 Tax=Actinomadura sp. 1N219 TaxID=3375152 RepID=UPI0037A795BC
MTCVGLATTQPADALAGADHVVADLKDVDVVPGPALRVRGLGRDQQGIRHGRNGQCQSGQN